MPELPEVETVRRSLSPHLAGRTVKAVDIRRRDVIRVVAPNGRERPLPLRAGAAHLLASNTIRSLERHGKQLAIVTSTGRTLIVHLGMTGQLVCLPPGAHLPDAAHLHVVWRLDTGARLVFRDPRRFGGVWSLPDRLALQDRWALLGPDAATITYEQLTPRLSRSSRPIKSCLLDQEVLAGVGNIYADESLFLARIAPHVPARTLTETQIRTLADSIHTVLARAIEAGGSSVADYVNGDGAKGSFQNAHAVYGRAGQPCMICGDHLASAVLGGRTTVWCPTCQKTDA